MPEKPGPNRSPTVLVVDDEEPIRQLARAFLERDGYQITEAGSGLEAIALLASGPLPDVLMTDLNMPELAGDEMVRRIRATTPDLRVLYVTGHVDRLLANRPILRDGEAFLEKPFNAAGLREAVSLLLYGTVKKQH
jgi:two-component system cell cycle sensor histidine kinase/response regulator CckA